MTSREIRVETNDIVKKSIKMEKIFFLYQFFDINRSIPPGSLIRNTISKANLNLKVQSIDQLQIQGVVNFFKDRIISSTNPTVKPFSNYTFTPHDPNYSYDYHFEMNMPQHNNRNAPISLLFDINNNEKYSSFNMSYTLYGVGGAINNIATVDEDKPGSKKKFGNIEIKFGTDNLTSNSYNTPRKYDFVLNFHIEQGGNSSDILHEFKYSFRRFLKSKKENQAVQRAIADTENLEIDDLEIVNGKACISDVAKQQKNIEFSFVGKHDKTTDAFVEFTRRKDLLPPPPVLGNQP